MWISWWRFHHFIALGNGIFDIIFDAKVASPPQLTVPTDAADAAAGTHCGLLDVLTLGRGAAGSGCSAVAGAGDGTDTGAGAETAGSWRRN